MNSSPCRNDLLILAVLCLISFIVCLDVVDVDLMEARNFVSAREMVSDGNWLVPTMNGEIRLAKPPMPTWLAALSTKMTGRSDDLALLRLPSALAACLLVFAVYGLSWAMGLEQRHAFFTSAMLTTSLLAIDVGRTGTWDIFCHAFMAAALWALWAGLHQRRGRRAFIVAGLGLGLSFMSKGPVSFYALFLPFAIAYTATFGLAPIRREWPGLTLALVISLLLSSWWPLYIFGNHADLGLMVAHKESDAWASRHVQPLWYYWHFPVFTGGWLLWAVAALVRPYAVQRSANRERHTFFLLWLVAALILLSLIPEKKERYLLPAMIPLFFLIGDLAQGVIARFTGNREQRADRALVVAHTALMGLLAAALPFVLIIVLKKQGHPVDGVIVAFTLGSWSAATLLLRSLRRRQVELLLLTTIAFLALTTLTTLHYYGTLTTKNKEYKRVDSRALSREIGMTRVYFLGDPVDMRVIWDAGRRVYPWQEEEVTRSLAQGEPVAVLSKGEPFPMLSEKVRAQARVREIDTFDYSKKRPERRKIHLSLLQPHVRDAE